MSFCVTCKYFTHLYIKKSKNKLRKNNFLAKTSLPYLETFTFHIEYPYTFT